MRDKKVSLKIFLLISLTFFWVKTACSIEDTWYVAKNEDLKSFFESVISPTGKGVLVSKLASRKKITGKFNTEDMTSVISTVSRQMGLVWYADSNVIYIYDISELKSGLISLQNLSLAELNAFLKNAGLYSTRYPIKGGNKGMFYVSGPPVYVDMVINAAKILNQNSDGVELDRQKIGIIHLQNTFVTDRTYELRNEKITIPGIATIVSDLLGSAANGKRQTVSGITQENQERNSLKMPPLDLTEALRMENKVKEEPQPVFVTENDIKIIAYPGNNTILVKGTVGQVEFITRLVKNLDIPKRHIELSLWIVDIDKNDLDNLGVDWSGSISIGSKLAVGLNQSSSITTLDGTKFTATIEALEQKNRATVISKPVILTQENIPAIFDNNRSFYTKLIGERNVSLESVTYGTMISVLPRFTSDNQIELLLNIEDGSEDDTSTDSRKSDNIPVVGRTVISTIARVPQGKSLLIGGYTKDMNSIQERRIPILGSIPLIGRLFSYEGTQSNNTVRIFLIEPREITDNQMEDVNLIQQKYQNARKKLNHRDLLTDDFVEKWVNVYLSREQGYSYGH